MRTVGGNETILHDVKCVRLGFERLEGGSDILRSLDFEWRDFEPEGASRGLDVAHFQDGFAIANISHDCQPAETGDNLAQKFACRQDRSTGPTYQ
jgi:hypothetical protein